jgi:hypothetical protein
VALIRSARGILPRFRGDCKCPSIPPSQSRLRGGRRFAQEMYGFQQNR